MPRDENRVNRTTVLLLVLVGASHSMALNLDDVRITRQGRVYTAQLTFDITASVDQVTAVLTDYEHPNRLTPDVTKREVISRRSGITRVRTEIHSCVALFCKNLTLTQDVTVVAGAIRADVVPEESDFRSGYILWLVTSSDNGGSHIQYDSVIEPDFFIPPLIGSKSLPQRRISKERPHGSQLLSLTRTDDCLTPYRTPPAIPTDRRDRGLLFGQANHATP